ncbi:hypothetical protein IMAU80627_02197 [Lactobacillus helveticus]|nr:hypothetical protein [Lactobacillus helveticus]
MSDIYDAYVDPNYYTLNSPDQIVLIIMFYVV